MSEEKEEVETHDPHFEPIISLPTVDIKTLEEEEESVLQVRAKLYRYDSTAEPPEWKERGTGECKILRHKTTNLRRILMRRDKTLKICANHYIAPGMELRPNCGSDRAWVWSTPADFADQESKAELLAIRFRDAETAQKFKKAFDEAKDSFKLVGDAKENGDEANPGAAEDNDTAETADVADKLQKLSVQEEKGKEGSASSKGESTEAGSKEADSKDGETKSGGKEDEKKGETKSGGDGDNARTEPEAQAGR